MASRGGSDRRGRRSVVLRWVAVATLALVAFLYLRPIKSYLDTRRALAARRAEVVHLRAQRRLLHARLAAWADPVDMAQEARRHGFVKPGEQLFVVKGIEAWRRAQRATIGAGG